MTTAYSTLLGLALPVTGELAGQWGQTVNDYITKYLDSAVAGAQTISGSQTAVTLSVTNGTDLTQAGSGGTGSAQYAIINCTGNPASLLTITAPAASKVYLLINATSTSQSVKLVGAGPTTGVTVISGEKALIAWNGSDFVKVASTAAAGGSNTQVQYNSSGVLAGSANLTFDGTTLTANALTLTNKLTIANGGTNATATPTAGAVAYGTGSAYAFTAAGTSNQVLISNGASAPTWSSLSSIGVTTFSAGTTGFTPSSATSGAITLAGTLATTNGGTGLTSFTANGVVYASSTSALATGSALTFDGTTLGVGTSGGGYRLAATAATNLAAFSDGSTQNLFLTVTSGSGAAGAFTFNANNGGALVWQNAGAEQMRLTSTGLGIGTSSPAYKVDAVGSIQSQGTHGAGSFNAFIIKNTLNSSGSGKISWQGSSSNETWAIAQNQTVGAGYLEFNYLGSNKAVFDPSGNLGLGVTPSAWSSSYKAISVGYAGGQQMAGGTGNSQALWTANLIFTGTGATGWKLPNNVAGTNYEQYLGSHKWYYAAANGVNGDATLVQYMTLDASGNLGVGTTSPTDSTSFGRALDIASGTGASVFVRNTANSAYYGYLGMYSTSLFVYNNASGPIQFGTGNTERARIDSSGTFYIGDTSTVNNARLSVTGDSTQALNSTFGAYTASTSFGGQFVYLKVNTAAGTGFNIIQGNNSGGECFKVAGNGNVANTNNSYGSLSDVKLKENIVDATPKLADLMQVKVRNYNLKAQPDQKHIGVIAQELEQVFPGMVEESPDRDEEGNSLGTTTKAVKYSVFVPMLVKAIQEQQALIQQLTARVAQLEGK